MKSWLRAICEACLRKLTPACDHAEDIPMLVAWNQGDGHYCPYCKWQSLQWYTVSAWQCPGCKAQFRSIPTPDVSSDSDPDLEITLPRVPVTRSLVPVSHSTEKLSTQDFRRKLRTGEISMHGEWRPNGFRSLVWTDTGELVNADQLPT